MNSVVNEPKPEVDNKRNTDKIKLVKVQSRIESEIYLTGEVSKRQYYWHKSGDTVLVQEEDVPAILTKSLGKRFCCGSGDNKIFIAI